jgi:hypothetical protein
VAELDDQVADMLGSRGPAYAAAWELWHRGAAEVQVGLSLLAKLIANSTAGDRDNHGENDYLTTALPVPQPGRAAAAYAQAHRHWARGEAMLRESLVRLRDATAAAHATG